MKTIIKLLIILIIGLILYNYFYGDEKERETSAQVVDHAKQLGKSLWDMISTEKDRFADGKHQEIMENIGSTIGFIRDNREVMDISISELEDLEKHKYQLDSLLVHQSDGLGDDEKISEEAREKLQLLLNKIENLIGNN